MRYETWADGHTCQERANDRYLDFVAPDHAHLIFSQADTHLLINHVDTLDDQINVPALFTGMNKPVKQSCALSGEDLKAAHQFSQLPQLAKLSKCRFSFAKPASGCGRISNLPVDIRHTNGKLLWPGLKCSKRSDYIPLYPRTGLRPSSSCSTGLCRYPICLAPHRPAWLTPLSQRGGSDRAAMCTQ